MPETVLTKLQALRLRPTTLLKRSLWHRCFLVNFVKFLKIPFFTEHLRWLLLIEFKSYDEVIVNYSANLYLFNSTTVETLVFSCIWTEYGEILHISLRIQSECGKI